MTPAHRLPRVALVGATLLLTACSGSDDASVATTPPTPEAPATTEGTATTTLVTTATTEPPATTAPETTEAPATTVAAEAWAPIGDGPYEVGVATITLDDPAGVRPLTVDVWFPLEAGTDVAALPPQQYTLLPGVYYESPAAVAGTADLLAADGPFPLVVYSHGSGGLRYIHSSYTEALAGHGFVVAAPDHTGNTALERITGSEAPFEETAFNRPTDVRRVIDALTDPTHPTAGPYAAAVDGDLVAVTGHSFGGFTTVVAVTGYTNERGTIEPDPRVDAIVPIAPALSAQQVPDDLLATIDVPMLVLVGTDDVTTPVDPNVTRLWDLTTNTPAYRVELVAGEHQTFTDLCSYLDFVPRLSDIPEIILSTIESFAVEGCSPGDIDTVRAADLTNTYVIQFLDQVLRGGPTIDPTIVAPPDDVIFAAR